MTIRNILEGYGIDFNSLTFKMNPNDPEPLTAEEAKQRLKEDEFIVDGKFIEHIDIVSDDPYGFIELYAE